MEKELVRTALDETSDLKLVAKELVAYREGVETLIRLGSSSIIPNGQPAHAAILFEIFFQYAEDHVRIFCEKLSQRVYGNASVVEAACLALKRGKKISVIHQEVTPEDGILLNELNKAKCVVVRAPEEARSWGFNFSTMDDRAYRFESSPPECKATASMNDREFTRKLVRKFDELVMLTILEKRAAETTDVCSAAAAI